MRRSHTASAELLFAARLGCGAAAGAAAAESAPKLQQLKVSRAITMIPSIDEVPLTGTLPQQLTSLELQGHSLPSPTALHPLTALQHLHLESRREMRVAGDILPALVQLTSLCLIAKPETEQQYTDTVLDPAVLSKQTNLQRLQLLCEPHNHIPLHIAAGFAGTAAAVGGLLAAIGTLQRLTSLYLQSTSHKLRACAPSAAAYSALAASSHLQFLDLSHGFFPVDVWDNILPGEQQLPHLRELRWSPVAAAAGSAVPRRTDPSAADVRRIVSGCPGLIELVLYEEHEYPHTNPKFKLPCALLSPISRLTRLRTLRVWAFKPGCVEVLAQLQSLRSLIVDCGNFHDTRFDSHNPLPRLTQLTQLTQLQS